MNFQEIPGGGVTNPLGFKASGVHAGIKAANKTKPDVAVLYSDIPAAAAGVFTQNLVKAAPVLLSQEVIKKGTARALVVNSGNANACTGMEGEESARLMGFWAGRELGISPDQVVVSSTGVIGHQLPREIMETGIIKAAAALDEQGGHDAAVAIMTTDTYCKEKAISFSLGDKVITIGGMCKGSGMIHPNMATMLCFLTSDIEISAPLLQKALKSAADKSFNMITVDGDTSTNDMMVMLANGKAGNELIDHEGAEFALFQEALELICIQLAKMIAQDGEGATKLLEVQVKNAAAPEDARIAAKAVISSSLVKSAFFGEDANWGRIICAVGYSGAKIDPYRVDIWLESAAGREQMAKQGTGLLFDEENAKRVLHEKEVKVIIDLNQGGYEAAAWGCDLTYDYVKINADYRT